MFDDETASSGFDDFIRWLGYKAESSSVTSLKHNEALSSDFVLSGGVKCLREVVARRPWTDGGMGYPGGDVRGLAWWSRSSLRDGRACQDGGVVFKLG